MLRPNDPSSARDLAVYRQSRAAERGGAGRAEEPRPRRVPASVAATSELGMDAEMTEPPSPRDGRAGKQVCSRGSSRQPRPRLDTPGAPRPLRRVSGFEPRGGSGRGARAAVATGVAGGAGGSIPGPPAVLGGAGVGAPRDPRV